MIFETVTPCAKGEHLSSRPGALIEIYFMIFTIFGNGQDVPI